MPAASTYWARLADLQQALDDLQRRWAERAEELERLEAEGARTQSQDLTP